MVLLETSIEYTQKYENWLYGDKILACTDLILILIEVHFFKLILYSVLINTYMLFKSKQLHVHYIILLTIYALQFILYDNVVEAATISSCESVYTRPVDVHGLTVVRMS